MPSNTVVKLQNGSKHVGLLNSDWHTNQLDKKLASIIFVFIFLKYASSSASAKNKEYPVQKGGGANWAT